MNVYVESNFVLEHALEQEQCESCDQLITLASAGSIQLLIPAFSLAEPHLAISSKRKTRDRLSQELRAQLYDLGRSRPHRDAPDNFRSLAVFLLDSAERERKGLERTIKAMLRTAQVIPLDSDVFHWADSVPFGLGRDMSAQDSIVLASIISHLTKTVVTQSCFMNRNTKDFDDPTVQDLLGEYGCKFFGSFDQGLRYVMSQLRKDD